MGDAGAGACVIVGLGPASRSRELECGVNSDVGISHHRVERCVCQPPAHDIGHLVLGVDEVEGVVGDGAARENGAAGGSVEELGKRVVARRQRWGGRG